jgi:hypothetical protein
MPTTKAEMLRAPAMDYRIFGSARARKFFGDQPASGMAEMHRAGCQPNVA